jgi:hypothetical protein
MPRNRPRRRRPLDRHHERAPGHLAGTAEPRRAACVADRAARPEPPGGPLSPSGCESRTVSRRHPVGFFNPRPFPRWRRRPRAGQHCRHIVTRRSSHAPAPKPFPGGAPLSGPVRDSYKFGVPPDVSELGHCVPRARRLPSWLAEGQPRMTSVLRTLPLSYAMLSEGRRGGSAFAVHEPSPAGPSARATPPRRSPESSTPRVRLHLKPGQKGTKQLLAQYGDRLICVRYSYDAQRKKRFKTVELLVAERDWEPPRPRFAPDQIVGLRVAFADVAVRDRVKQAGGTWNPARRVWQLRYDRVVALGLNSRIVDEPASNSGCPGASGENLHADAWTPSR